MKNLFKNLFADIWERISHWKTTSTGIILGVSLFCFLYYALNEKLATFEQISTVLIPMVTIVLGALMKDKV